MYLVFEKDVRVTGIPGYRFVTPREVLASPEENPENECFCKGGEYGPCLKTGAMRLAPCRNGTPVVISWPHFYNGDEEYRNQSIGMQPHAELHDTFVILEPVNDLQYLKLIKLALVYVQFCICICCTVHRTDSKRHQKIPDQHGAEANQALPRFQEGS